MKLCIVCFGFVRQKVRLQPWKYFYELAKEFSKRGNDTVIITDKTGDDDPASFHPIRVRYCDRLCSRMAYPSKDVIDLIQQENPDITVINVGSTSPFWIASPRIPKPTVMVLTSPLYSPEDVFRVGLTEFVRHPSYLITPLLSSFIPGRFITRYFDRSDCVVTLNEYNQKILSRWGIHSNIVTIPPGIDSTFLHQSHHEDIEVTNQQSSTGGKTVLLYYTSPLTLRGTDTLVYALERLPDPERIQLRFLSRRDDESLKIEEENLIQLIHEKGLQDSIEFISENLPPEKIRSYISCSDIVCLPLKIMISDFPVSFLEVMSQGKPIISTNVGCIPDILRGRGIVVSPNDPARLSEAIQLLVNDMTLRKNLGMKARELLESYPTWAGVADEYVKLFEGLVSDEN